MRYNQRPYLLHLILTLSLSTAFCAPSFAEGITLLSIGPRVGFGRESSPLGERGKIIFPPGDIAAVFKLPWSWPLGEQHVESGDKTDSQALGYWKRQMRAV